MAVHYYRPDFTEGQARSLIGDMVEDLVEFDIVDVETAITDYRRTPPAPGKSKYFPDSGTLRKLAAESREDRKPAFQSGDGKILRPEYADGARPACWWVQAPYLWQPSWSESDIPEDHKAAFRRRLNHHRKIGTEYWGENDFYGYYRAHNKGSSQ